MFFMAGGILSERPSQVGYFFKKIKGLTPSKTYCTPNHNELIFQHRARYDTPTFFTYSFFQSKHLQQALLFL